MLVELIGGVMELWNCKLMEQLLVSWNYCIVYRLSVCDITQDRDGSPQMGSTATMLVYSIVVT